MFLKAYESRTIWFPENGWHVTVTCFPNGEYGATRDEIDEGKYQGYGDTPLAAIADLWAEINDE